MELRRGKKTWVTKEGNMFYGHSGTLVGVDGKNGIVEFDLALVRSIKEMPGNATNTRWGMPVDQLAQETHDFTSGQYRDITGIWHNLLEQTKAKHITWKAAYEWLVADVGNYVVGLHPVIFQIADGTAAAPMNHVLLRMCDPVGMRNLMNKIREYAFDLDANTVIEELKKALEAIERVNTPRTTYVPQVPKWEFNQSRQFPDIKPAIQTAPMPFVGSKPAPTITSAPMPEIDELGRMHIQHPPEAPQDGFFGMRIK